MPRRRRRVRRRIYLVGLGEAHFPTPAVLMDGRWVAELGPSGDYVRAWTLDAETHTTRIVATDDRFYIAGSFDNRLQFGMQDLHGYLASFLAP